MHVEGTRFYRVKAVAEMFDVSVSAIYRAIAAGQLVALKVGSGQGPVLIPEDAVNAYRMALTACQTGGDVVSGEVA